MRTGIAARVPVSETSPNSAPRWTSDAEQQFLVQAGRDQTDEEDESETGSDFLGLEDQGSDADSESSEN
jgi:hypothetical protein